MPAAPALAHDPPLRRLSDRDSLNSDDRTSVSSRDPSPLAKSSDLPRSASYTYIPRAKDSAYGSQASLPITIKGSVSEDDYEAPLDSADVTPPDSSGYNTPCDEPRVFSDALHDAISDWEKSPAVVVTEPEEDDEAKTAVLGAGSSQANGSATTIKPVAEPAAPDTTLQVDGPATTTKEAGSTSTLVAPGIKRTKSFTQRLSRRLSKAPSRSRSPSPSRLRAPASAGEGASKDARPTLAGTRKKSILKRRDTSTGDEQDGAAQPLRKPTILKRRSTVTGKAGKLADHDAPPVPKRLTPLPKSFSTDRLPTTAETHHDESAVPVPRMVSGERVASFGSLALAKKKDELWSIFRTLDVDYTKFSSKSTALKANVVRQSLLPFLRQYADHASNHSLRPEDLDRRTNILNKWWVGLLEILHGKNNQSLSGTDRPAILEGLSGLMDRIEWRYPPSIFAPLSGRAAARDAPMTPNKSASSLASMGGDFLAESVHHNVRNLFVQNLQAQMAFVVDKMSLRNASASLVTFCGKATAFAFFFCPGMADILVRLWNTTPENMRRVLTENGVGHFEKLTETAADIASVFPPAVQSVGFVSLPSMMRTLRQHAPAPLGTADMQWYGYWLERWLGRESDLFYVFVKHYHILAMDYLPSDVSKKERMCAPGMLLVHCQILTNLHLTIHRDDVGHGADGPHHNPSFDDLLGETDAAVSTLPLLPPNAMRIMAENRLIMLIRDFLSDRFSDHPAARHLFAVSFNDLLHAAARKTSIFNHAACYTLCDFLEEALLILVRYEHLSTCPSDVVDSGFWKEVCKKMLTSQNTLTEIRLFAFTYSIWGIVCSNQSRKADFCLGFLLDDDVFERTFNHWCPMVRAYYMRLLCWRLGRFDGEPTELDTEIYERLFELLRREWSYFLYSREDAERRHALPPSTAPANPAPGRRLLIIRTDTQIAPGGSFLAFNGVIPPSPATPLDAAWTNPRRPSVSSQMSDNDFRPASQQSVDSDFTDKERESGLRSFLRGIMGGSSKRKPGSTSTSRPVSRSASQRGSPTPTPPNGMSVLARSATDDGTGNYTPRPRVVTPKPQPPARNFCFKFSLEFNHKLAANPPINMRLFAPRLPLPAQQYLQSRAPGIPAVRAQEPKGENKLRTIYVGRALAEWTMVTGEYQGFFERRRGEGITSDKFVETPTLGVEVFRRSA